MLARNPIENGELTEDEIKKCEKTKILLKIKTSEIPFQNLKQKVHIHLCQKSRQTNGIYWLVKNFLKYLIQRYAKLLVQQKKRFSP